MAEFPIEAVLFALGAYLALAVVASPFVESLDKYLAAPLRNAFKSLNSSVDGFVDRRLAPAFQSLQEDAVRVGNGLGEAVVPIEGALESPMSFFKRQADVSMKVLTLSKGDPAQRILGAIIYGVAIVIFAYTDAALGVNSATAVAGVSNIPPPDVPAWLQSLNVPIVVAFMGNMLILGVILADLYHITDFAPWPRSGKILTFLRAVVLLNIMAVVALGLGFMLARVVALTPGISNAGQTAETLNGIAIFSMNAITGPALITTLLLVPGFLVLMVLWLVLNGAFAALTALFRFMARWWQSLWPLVGKAGSMILGWIGAVIAGGIRLGNWVIAAFSTLIDLVLGAIGAVILTAVYPPRQVWEWMLRFDFIAYTILRRPGRPHQAKPTANRQAGQPTESAVAPNAEQVAASAAAPPSGPATAVTADAEHREAAGSTSSKDQTQAVAAPSDPASGPFETPTEPGPFKKYTK